MMSGLRWKSTLRFLIASRSAYFIGALIAVMLGTAILLKVGGLTAAARIWSSYLDPPASFAVLVIALAVWFGELRQDWHAPHPCRLTVVFRYGDREVMRCERAGLAAEGDMRALAQQIGAQMVGGRHLDFCAPDISHSGGHLEDGEDGQVFRHFTIELRLSKLPEKIVDLPNGHILLWRPPFHQEPTTVRRS